MKRFLTAAAVCLFAGGLLTGTSTLAKPHGWHDHSDWRKGGYVAHADWDNAPTVDYRAHHLHKPPRGYEWRQVNGKFVEVAVATGLIAAILNAN